MTRIEGRRDHVRSPEVEELLGLVRDPFAAASATHSILTNADMTFAPAENEDGSETIELAQSTVDGLENHPDRGVRRTAWEHYADAHLAYKNSMANSLIAGVKQDVFLARARRYDSSLEAALAPEGIPVAVFHNLIDTYRKHLPTWHRYWRVRRNALGYDTLHEYDIKAPLTTARIDVPYEQAVDWIARAWRRWATSTSKRCAAARWKNAGSISTPTRARAQARSPGARPAPIPSS